MSEPEPSADTDKAAPPGQGPGLDPAALAQAIGGGAADPVSLLLGQLTAQSPDDPRVSLLTQLMQKRIAASPPASPDEAEDNEARRRADDLIRAQAVRVRELEAALRQGEAETKALRARNDEVAAALGACFLCFGADPYCSECGGHGAPGSRPPEPAAWREYVLPALKRVRTLQSNGPGRGASRPAPGTASPPAATPA
jgi:hypothetical protein